MQVRRVAALATLATLALGAHVPAGAAAKKPPVKKSYEMQLPPFPYPAQGTPTCDEDMAADAFHIETLKTTGPGTLTVKVNGFQGDWDITVYSGEKELEGTGEGTSTPNTSTSPGEDVFTAKFKKPVSLEIRTCNFAGTPSAHGEYTFVYK
jgi:hypothetical protein